MQFARVNWLAVIVGTVRVEIVPPAGSQTRRS